MRSIILALIMAALAAAQASPARAQDYMLGEGDLVKISVYENEDLTTVTRVSGDGIVNVPLIGKMKAAGLTADELERELTAKLAGGYLVDPHVTVFVEEYRSKKVTILGEVNKPGLYELNGHATMLEIISKAGGLTDKAGKKILVKRGKGPDFEYLDVDISALVERGDASVDIGVQDGDNIFVTKSGFIYVTGQVKKPGAYKYEEGTTVMKAIALAEGLTETASPRRTVVIRKNGEHEEKIKADMDFPVQPDDLISVPESFF